VGVIVKLSMFDVLRSGGRASLTVLDILDLLIRRSVVERDIKVEWLTYFGMSEGV
jgi:hypothetical protein